MYFVEENRRSKTVQTRAMRSCYYAISPNKLLTLMEEAGLRGRKATGRYFLPASVDWDETLLKGCAANFLVDHLVDSSQEPLPREAA